jgi:hypothetical protein
MDPLVALYWEPLSKIFGGQVADSMLAMNVQVG